jgi:hypothetical protein
MQNRALAKTSRQPTPAELETLSTALAREHAAKVADLESAAAAGDGQAHKELARMKKERTQPKTHQDYEVSTHSHSWPTDVVLKAAGQGTEEERDLNVRVLESREDLWPVLLPLVAPKGKINSRVVAKFREVQADKFAGRIEQLHEDPMTMEEFGHRAENPMKHPYFQG